METFKLKNLLFTYSFEIPAYQRAYSWGEKQVNDFWNDINEYSEKKQYYFGHFLFEPKGGENNKLLIVDGQQRLTTVYLFKLISNAFNNEVQIFEFSTVEYDNEVLKEIKNAINEVIKVFNDNELSKAGYEIADTFLKKISDNSSFLSSLKNNYDKGEVTRSSKNIINALYFLYNQLKKENSKIKKLNEVVDNSIITHLIFDREGSNAQNVSTQVAIDIFELHNTRGIPVSTIEKVKAKLMSLIIEHGGNDENINKLQKYFSDIFKIEEQTMENFFRGEMPLDKILLHHLRVIDDGNKKDDFNNPSIIGNREEKILEYIKNRINGISKNSDKVKYIEDLTREFYNSVFVIGKVLPEWDKKCTLVGDVLILDRELSAEFFLLLMKVLLDNYYQSASVSGCDTTVDINDILRNITLRDILKKWEKFVYIRDFHDRYYRTQYRDDFPRLFKCISGDKKEIEELIKKLNPNKEKAKIEGKIKNIDENPNKYEQVLEQIEIILDAYLEIGFRPDRFEKGEYLEKVVYDFINRNKERILKNAYYWFPEKMKYLLYKYYYYKKQESLMDREYLRKVFKEGVSVEHILPHNWHWEWIGADPKNLTEDNRKFNESISEVINGIGNLMLLTAGDNSKLSDKKPTEKIKILQENKIINTEQNGDVWGKWESYGEWRETIDNRGENIFNFLIKYFDLKEEEKIENR